MRFITLTILFAALTGCGSISSGLSSLTPKAIDTSFYLIDRKAKFMCEGDSKSCRDLTYVVSSRAQLAPIEKAYGQKVAGPNYPANLATMLIYPQDKSYQATPVGSEGRYFRIPNNQKTQIAWLTLTEIQDSLINQGGGAK